MEKASGVYLTITDNSFIAQAGTQALKVIVPMLTNKGKVGLNYVTADTFKDIVGYDPEYNSNYVGLSRILENVAYAQVWRLNQGTKLANAYFESKTSEKKFNDDAETPEDVLMMDPAPLIAVGNKSTGDWQTSAVKINPLHSQVTQQNTNATEATPQVITLDPVNQKEVTTLGEVEVSNGLIFYNSSDNAVVGAVKKNIDGEWKVYKVVDGEIVDDVVEEKKPLDPEEPEEPDVPPTDDDDNEDQGDGGKGDDGDEDEDRKEDGDGDDAGKDSSDQNPDESGEPEKAATLKAVIAAPLMDSEESDDEPKLVIVEDNSIGSVEFNEDSTIVTLVKIMSKDSFWNVHFLPETLVDWTLTLAAYDGRNYSIKGRYDFSVDAESDKYVDNVDFGDLFFKVNGTVPADMPAIRDYFTLDGGSNGNGSIVAMDVDVSVLDNCGYNVMAMNGLTDYKVINRIATKIKENKIHLFADVPAYASYIDAENWVKKLANSEYLAVGGRPDKVEMSEGKYIYVYPSVNYVRILSQMKKNFGSLNFPPAGLTYGQISVEELIDCDYEMYADELKTNRINWQRVLKEGSVMWEQRTTYSLNTDLSYIAPVFIVDQVAEDIVDFERQFNFRYMTPTDILNQDSGLSGILQGYVDKGFLYSFNLNMPTYAEAQKAGRTLTIPIEIVIMKDSEVIELNLILNNAS